jgi:hypothetical protein
MDNLSGFLFNPATTDIEQVTMSEEQKAALRERVVTLATSVSHETIYDLLIDADKIQQYLLTGVLPDEPTNPESL